MQRIMEVFTFLDKIKYLTHIAYRFLRHLRYSTHPSLITPGPSISDNRSMFLKTYGHVC